MRTANPVSNTWWGDESVAQIILATRPKHFPVVGPAVAIEIMQFQNFQDIGFLLFAHIVSEILQEMLDLRDRPATIKGRARKDRERDNPYCLIFARATLNSLLNFPTD